MNVFLRLSSLILYVTIVTACQQSEKLTMPVKEEWKEHKIFVYQVFTRLFGNTNSTNKAWGTIEENGVGKMNDFTDKALKSIKDLGITHIWYTGIPHHALIGEYSFYGISSDDPDVVKGRAGSPYAVKDYYDVDPDIAIDPAKRIEEFVSLVQRTHDQGMKVIIDIVPNHVARNYHSTIKLSKVVDFGENDDTTLEYKRNNNFYYIPGKPFKVPVSENGYLPLGGEKHPLSDGKFDENPAKWTGNGSRLAQPNAGDWYETVKINYGIRPDGTKDFDLLPDSFKTKSYSEHIHFWLNKKVPDSWIKFRDITLYWMKMGVDGFRFDMAEMVPVEFWSYLNSTLKSVNPEIVLIAEVYNPDLYRDYIRLGKMDFLYDKVAFYDSIKKVMQGKSIPDVLSKIQSDNADIEFHLLHFLENHDEQRIASNDFVGNPLKGKPAMVVSTTISTSPTLIYFGQEVGEEGAQDAGFGKPSRTSIFDYIGVPAHQRWMNGGEFDGGMSTTEEKSLRDFYSRLLNFSNTSIALLGQHYDLQGFNRFNNPNYPDLLYSFARWKKDQKLIIVSNFNDKISVQSTLLIPDELIKIWNLSDGSYQLTDQLYETFHTQFEIKDGIGSVKFDIQPLESFIFELNKQPSSK